MIRLRKIFVLRKMSDTIHYKSYGNIINVFTNTFQIKTAGCCGICKIISYRSSLSRSGPLFSPMFVALAEDADFGAVAKGLASCSFVMIVQK